MISENKISPNYQARAISDLDTGTLFFVVVAGSFKPHLIAQGEKARHLVSLCGDYFMAREDQLPNSKQIVYALSQEWRFRLINALPQKIVNPTADQKMIGKISICEGLRAITVNIGDDDLYLLDIDLLSPANDQGVYSHRGIQSDWVVETRSTSTEPWTKLFSNTDTEK